MSSFNIFCVFSLLHGLVWIVSYTPRWLFRLFSPWPSETVHGWKSHNTRIPPSDTFKNYNRGNQIGNTHELSPWPESFRLRMRRCAVGPQIDAFNSIPVNSFLRVIRTRNRSILFTFYFFSLFPPISTQKNVSSYSPQWGDATVDSPVITGIRCE